MTQYVTRLRTGEEAMTISLSEIEEMRRSGMTLRAIGKALGISQVAVYYRLHPERRSYAKDDVRSQEKDGRNNT